MKRRWFAFGIAFALTACGGGDNAMPPTPQLRAPVYEHQASAFGMTAEQRLAVLNTEGAKGYRFVTGQSFTSENNAGHFLFVNDSVTTYTYKLLPAPATPADFVAQANAEGGGGFQFAGPNYSSVLYRRNAKVGVSYDYLAAPKLTPYGRTRAAFLEQANALGALGYRFVMERWSNSEAINLYERSSAGGTYAYELLDEPATEEELLTQMNAQGARGFRSQSAYVVFEGDVVVRVPIYMRDTEQASKFSMRKREYPSTSVAMLAQANEEGSSQNSLLEAYSFSNKFPSNFYFKALNCHGELCITRSPFGF